MAERPAPIGYVSSAEFCRRAGISARTLYVWRVDGTVPAPQWIGGRMAWPEAEVRAWLVSRPRRRIAEPVEAQG